MRIHRIAAYLALGVAISSGYAQIANSGAASTGGASPRVRQVSPFSMVQTETTEHTYANGLVVTSTLAVRTYRASNGSMRTDRQVPSPESGLRPEAPGQFWRVNINSLPDGSGMSWVTLPGGARDAYVHHLHPAPTSDRIPRPEPAFQDPNLKPQRHTEQLGEKNIDGLIAEGMRSTITYPVASIGNNLEFTSIHESWTSRLSGGIAVESTADDPRYGKRTMKLVSFTPGEPDAAFFQPPAGYRVVDAEKQ